MRGYHEVFGHELPPLPREPVLSDFYTLADEQHYSDHSILECYNLFSGVELSMRLFFVITESWDS